MYAHLPVVARVYGQYACLFLQTLNRARARVCVNFFVCVTFSVHAHMHPTETAS